MIYTEISITFCSNLLKTATVISTQMPHNSHISTLHKHIPSNSHKYTNANKKKKGCNSDPPLPSLLLPPEPLPWYPVAHMARDYRVNMYPREGRRQDKKALGNNFILLQGMSVGASSVRLFALQLSTRLRKREENEGKKERKEKKKN